MCKCAATMCILLQSTVIIVAFSWLYLSTKLKGLDKFDKISVSTLSLAADTLFSHHNHRDLLFWQDSNETTNETTNETVVSVDYNYRLYSESDLLELSYETYPVLTNHSNDSLSISQPELDALQSIFYFFDANDDDKWTKTEFKQFMLNTVRPGLQFNKMDFNDDGLLSFAEITIFLQQFDRMSKFYKNSKTVSIIKSIFNYQYNASNDSVPDQTYYEYLAHLWLYKLSENKSSTISKAVYIRKIIEQEWLYNNLNDDRLINLTEFQSHIFNSIYYSSYSYSWSFQLKKRVIWKSIKSQLRQINESDINNFVTTTPPIHSLDDEILLGRLEYARPAESVFYVLPWSSSQSTEPQNTTRRHCQRIYGHTHNYLKGICLQIIF